MFQVPSERTVTVAVGHGKKAARHIDAWLRGGTYAPAPKHEIASADKLNTWYYGEAPKTLRPVSGGTPAAPRVSIVDNAFMRGHEGPTLTVRPGTVVTWRWRSQSSHNVTVRLSSGPTKPQNLIYSFPDSSTWMQ